MITAAVLVLLLQVVAAPAWCPIAGEPDLVVSCPGWAPRPCRTRNARGELVRSRAVVREFRRASGTRARKGYVIDHVRPLVCGGCDVPWNMVEQSAADARAKDRWERRTCE